jgi:aromatic-L-amino-acid decarboxylase
LNQDKSRITELETEARRLEPSPEERRRMTDAVFAYAAGFLDNIYSVRAFNRHHNHGRGLYDSPIGEDPIDIDAAVSLYGKNVDEPALTASSGGHVAYIPGGGIYPAALGDYLAAVGNNFAGIYYVSPGAVRMEHMLVRWMADTVGLPEGAGGDLTSGGSIANLMGIVTARDAHGLESREFHKAVIYVTRHVHHSVDKALRIAGLRDVVVRYVDMDERHRMSVPLLEEVVAADRKSGLVPWLVVASAGTTDTGAVDPLAEIAHFCRSEELWFHVDAAYGGFFTLCEEGKQKLSGIGDADSVVIDPHKGLFLPYGCGALLVRDRAKLAAAHASRAQYLQDAGEPDDEYSPANHSPELTRHFRGARLWLPLKVFGLRPFRACVQEKLLLARYFYDEMRSREGFETGPPPDLSVVTYRYIPKRGNADEFNRRLMEEVLEDGRVFINSTMLDGKFTLRMAALAFRTHLDTIDTLLELLTRGVRRLESQG